MFAMSEVKIWLNPVGLNMSLWQFHTNGTCDLPKTNELYIREQKYENALAKLYSICMGSPFKGVYILSLPAFDRKISMILQLEKNDFIKHYHLDGQRLVELQIVRSQYIAYDLLRGLTSRTHIHRALDRFKVNGHKIGYVKGARAEWRNIYLEFMPIR
jgi:hypothetical protein